MASSRIKNGSGETGEGEPSDVIVPSEKRVIIKFEDWMDLAGLEEADALPVACGPLASRGIAATFGPYTLAPLFDKGKRRDITVLVARAQRIDPTYRPPVFSSFFTLEFEEDIDLEQAARALASVKGVEYAYVEPEPAPPPTVQPNDDPYWSNQAYLDPAPVGIDAEYAWNIPGGDGEDQGFVDLERGWKLDHDDLAQHNVSLISGVNKDEKGHGTWTLGVVTAYDNGIGCVGIAPHLATVRVVSQWRTETSSSIGLAVLDAIGVMAYGDVLLIEAQQYYGGSLAPVEVYPLEYEAIRLATALGIVVVEPSGNGILDLDTLTVNGAEVLDRDNIAEFKDSGAIFVASGFAFDSGGGAIAWERRANVCCFGSRIDCFAWGEYVETLDTDSAGTQSWYTDCFGLGTPCFAGTSSAAAIVAGAALLVQGMAWKGHGHRLSPYQVRDLLSRYGTPTANPPQDRIGIMPDLKTITSEVLGLAPDLYLRDHAGDIGDPHVGPISASPDIILRASAEADPTAAFGEGSGTESSYLLGHEAKAGQDNYIYVRVKNRGGTDATDVKATIYWSEVSTLVTPDLWNLVGTVTVPSVPKTDDLVVSDALVWPASAVPATGHYCFVGLVGNDQEPAPDPSTFLDLDAFKAFIRQENNVTWRNFNVVGNAPEAGSRGLPGIGPGPSGGAPDFKVLELLAPGAPDKARRMSLEVLSRLPDGSVLAVVIPRVLAVAMHLSSPSFQTDPSSRSAVVPVKAAGKSWIGEGVFPRGSRNKLRLLVHIPPAQRSKPSVVAVRQVYDRVEVGRVTWLLVP